MKSTILLLFSLFLFNGLSAQASTESSAKAQVASATSNTENITIRRTLYFKFNAKVTPDDIEYVRTTFKGLRDQIEGMTEAIWMVAPDKEETYTHFLMLEFANQQALKAYEKHPDHMAIAAKGPSLMAGFYMQDYEVK
ncbi:MAG: Dabb family protein [Saprospiraceae bacterium]|nr:Dabb family protein [Saprospiraceae bacterium]